MDGFGTESALLAVVDPQLLTRLPLAEATLLMWRFVFDETRLQQLWEQTRGRCYDHVIRFPTMVHLIADALLQYGGSGRRSFEKNIEHGILEASVAAAFGKLQRLPLTVSQEFLESGTAAVRELYPAYAHHELPASLAKFCPLTLDGKTIKNVAKRLKPLRNSRGGLLGGKAVVATEWLTGLAVGLQPHADGDVSEKRLVSQLLARVRLAVAGPRLFVADRGFCDLVQMNEFTREPDDHFVVRRHGGLTFTRDPKRPEKVSQDNEGRRVVESWGWAGSVSHPSRRYVRRLQLLRPGEEDLVLLTDLLDEEKYPAADLLWLYRQRWEIERLFQKVTEVFDLQRLIGGTPQACVFQFAFCLLLYNVIQTLTGHVAQARQVAAETLSQEKLFDDVHRQLIAWNVLLEPTRTIAYFEQRLEAVAVQQRLGSLLANAWSETWWKSPPQQRRESAPQPKTRTHGSVYRILQEHLKKKRTKTRAAT